MNRPITKVQFAKALLKARREELKMIDKICDDYSLAPKGLFDHMSERVTSINDELINIENKLKEQSSDL